MKDRRGNIAMIFGLCCIPMIGLLGIAIDYTRAARAKAEFDSAADAAVLAAVSVARNTLLKAPSQSDAQQWFIAAAATMPDVTLGNVTLTSNTSVAALFVTVTWTATVPTTFANILGIPSMTISGTASSSRQLPIYVDFYLLLDNSPSMGLAATTADITEMQSVTPGPSSGTCSKTTSAASCAFACHQHTFNSSGAITGDDTTDCYHIAKSNNVTTRIDVLRTATQSLTATATGAETIPNQFRMGVYTFSDQFQTISGLSSSMPTVASNSAAIDLAYAYYNQRDTQTSYDTALTTINNVMRDPGDGTTAALPQEFLFLVTDGAEDEPVGSGSGSGDTQDKLAATGTAPASTNLSSSLKGNVNSTRLITTLDASLCTTIKNRGIKIAVLYTTYLPVTTNAFYNSWVKPISSSIPTKLSSCASPGFYFEVSPSQGIGEAMNAMFEEALSVARLTH
jgi:Flp pilus assembly protein TadG